MLHERTSELLDHFQEGRDCACFADGDELAESIRYYLDHPDERAAIAAQGLVRSEQSGYSISDRAGAVLARCAELRAERMCAASV